MRADRRARAARRFIRRIAVAARRFVLSESGQSAAEYALIMALIAASLIGVLYGLINAVANGILTPVNGLNNAVTGG